MADGGGRGICTFIVLQALSQAETSWSRAEADTIYVDKETGQSRETRDIVADNVGASLKFADVNVDRSAKANGPAADASGPVATPASYAGAELSR